MTEKKVIIVNPSGLHARPAARVVEFVKDYSGTAEVHYAGKSCSLKSILLLLTMGIKQGSEVILRVDGDNEINFINDISELIQNLSE